MECLNICYIISTQNIFIAKWDASISFSSKIRQYSWFGDMSFLMQIQGHYFVKNLCIFIYLFNELRDIFTRWPRAQENWVNFFLNLSFAVHLFKWHITNTVLYVHSNAYINEKFYLLSYPGQLCLWYNDCWMVHSYTWHLESSLSPEIWYHSLALWLGVGADHRLSQTLEHALSVRHTYFI